MGRRRVWATDWTETYRQFASSSWKFGKTCQERRKKTEGERRVAKKDDRRMGRDETTIPGYP